MTAVTSKRLVANLLSLFSLLRRSAKSLHNRVPYIAFPPNCDCS